jgi:hypothetical protein
MNIKNQEFKIVNSLLKSIRLGRKEQLDFWLQKYKNEYSIKETSIKFKKLFQDMIMLCVIYQQLHILKEIQKKFPQQLENNIEKILLTSSYINTQKEIELFNYVWKFYIEKNKKENLPIEQKFMNNLFFKILLNKNDKMLDFFLKNYEANFLFFHHRNKEVYTFLLTGDKKHFIYSFQSKILQEFNNQKLNNHYNCISEENVVQTLDIITQLNFDINDSHNRILAWSYRSYGMEMLMNLVRKYDIKLSQNFQQTHRHILPQIDKILKEKEIKNLHDNLDNNIEQKNIKPIKSLKI